MRIAIDLRCLQTPPPRGGVGVFAEALTRALLAHDHANTYTLIANGMSDFRHHLPAFDASNVTWRITRWPNKLLNTAWALGVGRWAFDAAFLPNLNFIPPIPRTTRLVVTVHDLSFVHFADCFSWKQRLWHFAIRPSRILARADAIIAVSETTKRDIVETYGIPETRIHVVYPGIEHAERNAQYAKLPDRIPERFIFVLAELHPRKNLDGLITAFEEIRTPHHLVLGGIHGSASRAIARQIARSPARSRIHLLGPMSEQEKRALLARATCFAYPSMWEGFGMPPLEAMAAGCPVVASTSGALPEILGGAALLVDPLDPHAIAGALHRACTNDTLRAHLIARGRERSSRYMWNEAAARLADIIGGTA